MRFSCEIPVHFSDSDATGRMSPVSVMRAMLESSMQHTASVQPDDFSDIWVLYQWDVQFHRFPAPGTRLLATTWTEGFYKFYAYRNFLLEENGDTVDEAHTVWLLLAGDTRKPRRVPENYAGLYGAGLLDRAPAAERKTQTADLQPALELDVRSYEIDSNQHVNNLVYADWVLESVPQEMKTQHALKRLVLTYRKQVVYPERIIISRSGMQDAVISHQLTDTKGELRAAARTEWK